MKKKEIPSSVPAPKLIQDNNGPIRTTARGMVVLNSPRLNRGTAFTRQERTDLGLTGLLPSEISTLEAQTRSAYLQYGRLPDALSKNVYLTALHDRNEVLFFRLFSEHLREMIPIVNDLTVGLAMEQYHHEFRRPRGLYLSIDHLDSMEESFANLASGPGDIDLILATDAEQILGIGDWGVGGIEVAIGKLAIYTAAGGIDPKRVIPVMLDVGTNRDSLLLDPMYIGNRHPRVRGDRYEEFLDAYVRLAVKHFPHAILQWEDFSPTNARAILGKYRDLAPTFNDDMQGTGAITLAATISAVRASGTPLRQQRILIFGAGTAGIGIADQIRDAMVREGLSKADATSRFWCVDRQGLLLNHPTQPFKDFQTSFRRPESDASGWKRDSGDAGIGLAETVHRMRPTMLIGASAVAGAFTLAIIKEMASHVERPIIFVLANPAASAEANPVDLIAWTQGRALVATGSPSPPVTYKGVTYAIAQINNAMLYPGLGLGAIVARAARISNGMFAAAASAVSSLVTVRQLGSSLLPHIDDLRIVSLTVATAVVDSAVAEGLARVKISDAIEEVHLAMWRPEYSRIEAC